MTITMPSIAIWVDYSYFHYNENRWNQYRTLFNFPTGQFRGPPNVHNARHAQAQCHQKDTKGYGYSHNRYSGPVYPRFSVDLSNRDLLDLANLPILFPILPRGAPRCSRHEGENQCTVTEFVVVDIYRVGNLAGYAYNTGKIGGLIQMTKPKLPFKVVI